MSGTKILSAEVSEFEIAIDVIFDNYMTLDAALINPANYTFDNGAYSRLVDVLDINTVRIWVELFYNNLSFTLTVSNVIDGYGSSILPPDNSIIVSPFYSATNINITNYNGKVRTWHDSSFIAADSQRVYLAGTKGIDVFRKLTPTSFLRWAQIYDAYGIDSMFVANFPNDIIFNDQNRPTVTNLDPNIADIAMPSTHITFDILDLSTAVEITEVKVYINSEIAFRGDYGGWYNGYSGNINIGYKTLSFDIWPSTDFELESTVSVRVFAKDLIGLYVNYSYVFYIDAEFGFGEFGFISFGGEIEPLVPPPPPGPTQIWVAMMYTSDGIYYSSDSGASFVVQAQDPNWFGAGTLWGYSPTRIVANVANYSAPTNYNPVAIWDGATWTVDTGVAMSGSPYCEVWCSEDEIFLVATNLVGSDRTWRRKSALGVWSTLDTLSSAHRWNYCHGNSNSAVTACGGKSVSGEHYVKFWDGSVVSQIYTSGINGWTGCVYAVSNNSIWYAWTKQSDNAIVIEHWDGASWTETHDVVYGTSANAAPTAMWFADANNGWLVTDGWSDDGGPILYWNGLAWASQTLPAGVVQFESFYSISGTSATDVYATSIHGTNCHLLHFDGATWSDITPAEWEALDLGGVVAFAS
jgi:hypothetical protein